MEINWDRFVILLLPKRLRIDVVFALIKCAFSPISYLHTKLLSYQNTVDYKLTHTGQVWSIQAVLNDVFDSVERRIYIEDAGREEPILLNRDTDDGLLILGDDDEGDFIHSDGDYSAERYDFVVYLPEQLTDDEMYRLKALVNYYRLAGKRYNVVVKLESDE